VKVDATRTLKTDRGSSLGDLQERHDEQSIAIRALSGTSIHVPKLDYFVIRLGTQKVLKHIMMSTRKESKLLTSGG
jgi:hypothetical protein